ncbi:MAG: hypothetical protein U5L45_05320 [Saprospiraceae bacterium]|nr:hypothetical protein [Saprospiraceae bacterium]
MVDNLNVFYEIGRSKNKLLFMFYVDGQYKGVYSNKDHEYGKRFGRAMKPKFGRKYYDLIRCTQGIRTANQVRAENNTDVSLYNPLHNSARSVINTLKKNNLSIKLKTD